MNRYTVSALIGEGSFGRVYKALRKDDAQVVAIKVISKRGRSARELKNLRRECDIQAELKHPNVIEMFESFETKHDLIVVTEFALMDFHRYLARNGALTETQAQGLICHLVSALYYLHSNRILHRDLKPQNVLLNENLHAKLCDFGLARNMTIGTHVLTSIKGTPLYMAPELLAEQPYNHQADLWSLGCISYESMAGQPPFSTTSILHLVKLIKHEEVKWPSFLGSDCRSLLQGLLEKDPSMRISWAEILCHPFVEGKLLIVGNHKASESPFINPKKSKPAPYSAEEQIVKNMSTINLNKSNSPECAEQLNSSRDSINAIPPSDVELWETDTEEQINRVAVPFADTSFQESNVKPQLAKLIGMGPNTHCINSQTCFVSGNGNMIINNLNDNFAGMSTTPSARNVTIRSTKLSNSKDLEKRKLSQNLDNFSLRLGHTIENDTQRKTNESINQKKQVIESKEKFAHKLLPLKATVNRSNEEKLSQTENSPPCLLPGWDSCDESQSPPIENEEWLAFLNRSMQEVLDGELDSLKQQNLVSIIVAPLRNSKAIPSVIQSVAHLLSLPFVLCEHASIMDTIKNVYVDVKLVPNLMYASKLLLSQKTVNDSAASLTQIQSKRQLRAATDLSIEELRTTSALYELICLLVHLKQQFLTQFCDAVAILAADEMLTHLLNFEFINKHVLRITNCILSLCCCVLRELPENAELVERIVFSPNINLLSLLKCKDNLLRMRMCMLLRLLGRFSSRSLQKVWNADMKKALKDLSINIDAEDVKEEAAGTYNELQHLSVVCN